MGYSININYIDWEDFCRRYRNVDWDSLDEEAEDQLSYELLNSNTEDVGLEGEFIGRIDSYDAIDAFEELEKVLIRLASEGFGEPTKRLAFWQRYRPHRLSSELHPLSNEEYPGFLRNVRQWIKEAKFVLQLDALAFYRPSQSYQDNGIDLSHFQDLNLNAISPDSVRAIAQRFPPPLLEVFPDLRMKSNGGRVGADFKVIDRYIHRWRGIVEKAEKGGKGLCIFVA